MYIKWKVKGSFKSTIANSVVFKLCLAFVLTAALFDLTAQIKPFFLELLEAIL